MKLCVFQGTFNPVHNAHLRLVKFVSENFDFDKILVIPAYKPPHKNFDKNLAHHRLNMAKLAFENFDKVEVSDIEFKKEDTSYTYLTIKELYKLYNAEGKISFIIGTDAFEKIETWYEAQKLKELVKFIVFIREDKFNSLKYNELKEKGFDFEIVDLSYYDISSTQIRKELKKENIPIKVKEYIEKNELYKNE